MRTWALLRDMANWTICVIAKASWPKASWIFPRALSPPRTPLIGWHKDLNSCSKSQNQREFSLIVIYISSERKRSSGSVKKWLPPWPLYLISFLLLTNNASTDQVIHRNRCARASRAEKAWMPRETEYAPFGLKDQQGCSLCMWQNRP